MLTVAHWPDVKATAIHTGNLKRAAEIHGISHDAVRQRASREQWPVGQRLHQMAQDAKELAGKAIIAASGGTVTHVTAADEAAEIANAQLSREIRSNGLVFAQKVTKHAAELAKKAPDVALAQAGDVKSALQGAAIAGKWDVGGSDQSTHLNFFQIATAPDDPSEKPVFECTSDDPNDY